MPRNHTGRFFIPAVLISIFHVATGLIATADEQSETLRAGIIGLDTSHVIAFSRILNNSQPGDDTYGCTVVAAYPQGSRDIESSVSRVPRYTEEIQQFGVEIVDSIDQLLSKVDVVLLETNDGRPHLEQVMPVLKAGKPVFVDKPVAGSLRDAITIYQAARLFDVPLFSSSSMRFYADAQAIRNGKAGDVLSCLAYSPCSLEATHPDFFWYGIHGVETLFTCMGTGCQSVTRTSVPDRDVAVGQWKDGRVGIFHGLRNGKTGSGGTVFGSKAIMHISRDPESYRPMIAEIVKFFRTGKPPVSPQETLEIYAFMEAADQSKREGGVPVTLQSVLNRAGTTSAWSGQWDGGGEHHGQLKCLVRPAEGDQWEATFTGYCNRQFAYEVKMNGTRKADRVMFTGKADLGDEDGGLYSWSGQLEGTKFVGEYSSEKGKKGSFQLTNVELVDSP